MNSSGGGLVFEFLSVGSGSASLCLRGYRAQGHKEDQVQVAVCWTRGRAWSLEDLLQVGCARPPVASPPRGAVLLMCRRLPVRRWQLPTAPTPSPR